MPLRIGLYRPGEKRPVEVLSQAVDATFEDRIMLAKSACYWLQQNLGKLRLGTFADDLKLVNDGVNGYGFS